MKPKLAIAPRKAVPEDAARQLEEALERKGEGAPGEALLPPPPAKTARDTDTVRATRSSDVRGVKRPASKSAHQLPATETGLGTRTNPRVRKTDGVKTRSTSVHLPVDLALKLTMHCARNGRRQSEVITQALEEWLSQAD